MGSRPGRATKCRCRQAVFCYCIAWRLVRRLKRDEIGMNRHRASGCCLSMILSENRFALFRIMLQAAQSMIASMKV
jgi:hypothetical protein